MKKIAIIIGAGPAGLTAAYELLDKTDIRPIVFENSADIGGLSKTLNYKGNRIDIGGHRFFSRSERINRWWENIIPLQGAPAADDIALGRKIPLVNTAMVRAIASTESRILPAPDPEKEDRVMLHRRRFSRILYREKFFRYPIAPTLDTLRKLGAIQAGILGASYLHSLLFPVKNVRSLEDFFINRFGRELYSIFFKEYTEKVWGVSCDAIGPEWGEQRVKGLSVIDMVRHACRSVAGCGESLSGNKIQSSLIGGFLYPKFGPGQLWEEVARQITEQGAEIRCNHLVTGLLRTGSMIDAVEVRNCMTGDTFTCTGDYVFSSMPVKDLVCALRPDAPVSIGTIAGGLCYRDFITVGILVKELRIRNDTGIPTINGLIPDTWIYVQNPSVRLGRIQIFNNWSPYMVKDPDTVWMGLEYFCNEGDDLWNSPDFALAAFAAEELTGIGFIDPGSVLDTHVIRLPKAYPAYFGSYNRFPEIRNFLDSLENLFPIGRNGMHRYNNMDHSMLTAMIAVENIRARIRSKENIWAVNTDDIHHEAQ